MEVLLTTFVLIIIGFVLLYFLMVNREDTSSVPYAKHGNYPIVGHLFTFLHDRTKFLIECYQQYGTCFRIRLLNQHFIFVFSPSDWPNIMRNPALYFPAGDHGKHIFDITPSVVG